MDKREAGRQKAEHLVAEVARGLKQAGPVGTLLWWTPDEPDDAKASLRIYRGNSWRAIEFAQSDVDQSADDPAVLKKYEGEIAQALTEL